MKKLFMIWAILLPSLAISQLRTITAQLLDSQTKNPIKDAIIKGEYDNVTSNYLGYFQLTVDSIRTLTISHIGYLTSQILIPDQDKFAVVLDRKYSNLGSLELDINPDVKSESETGFVAVNEEDSIKKYARYSNDWQEFYTELRNAITSSANYQQLDSSFSVNVLFTISEQGLVENVSVLNIANADILKEKEIIRQSLQGLKKWTPAIQNGKNTNQFFELHITRGGEIFTIVEESAHPVGGMQEFYSYIQKKLRYPDQARRMGVEGRVFVEFIVEKDGRLTEVKVVNGIGAGCDEEAVKLIEQSASWYPALQKQKPVKQKIVLPIVFDFNSLRASNEKETFNSFLAKNVKYPRTARRMGIEGTLYAVFQIDENTGNIIEAEINHDLGGECGIEVVRVLKIMPRELIKRLKHNTKYILPVTFGFDKAPDKKSKTNPPEGILLDELIIIATGSNPPSKSGSSINLLPLTFSSVQDALDRNKSVQRLSLPNRNIQILSPRISELSALTFLDLENNNLNELPEEIGELKKLKKLFLPINNLSDLPENFVQLSSLTTLGLAKNNFDDFPIQILSLFKLEALDLSENNISVIPSGISQLTRLKVLILNHTKLNTLPDEIYGLRKLEKIYLVGTSISQEEVKKIQSKLKKVELILE